MRRRTVRGVLGISAMLLLGPGALEATAQAPRLALRTEGAKSEAARSRQDRGFVAVGVEALRSLGWSVDLRADTAVARYGDLAEVRLVEGTPFFLWNGEVLQLVAAPYRAGGTLWVPTQLLSDFIPRRLAERFSYDPVAHAVTERTGDAPAGSTTAPTEAGGGGADADTEPAVETGRPTLAKSVVVVIDPGHGGSDPGAVGRNGVRDKDVALGVGRALARALAEDSIFDVRLTRDRDVFVPLWKRGEQATKWKGQRSGVFISLHANALPQSPATRGFEVYFLSEARTDHERRVAALENSAPSSERPGVSAGDPGLDFILTELRNLDHQHWSALLGEMVADELASVHPGPNRGVKQAPLAVLTNSLMPSVLVELGYVTNREDERLLGTAEFHEAAAQKIAAAVRTFFTRYPPGDAGGGARP